MPLTLEVGESSTRLQNIKSTWSTAQPGLNSSSGCNTDPDSGSSSASGTEDCLSPEPDCSPDDK